MKRLEEEEEEGGGRGEDEEEEDGGSTHRIARPLVTNWLVFPKFDTQHAIRNILLYNKRIYSSSVRVLCEDLFCK